MSELRRPDRRQATDEKKRQSHRRSLTVAPAVVRQSHRRTRRASRLIPAGAARPGTGMGKAIAPVERRGGDARRGWRGPRESRRSTRVSGELPRLVPAVFIRLRKTLLAAPLRAASRVTLIRTKRAHPGPRTGAGLYTMSDSTRRQHGGRGSF